MRMMEDGASRRDGERQEGDGDSLRLFASQLCVSLIVYVRFIKTFVVTVDESRGF